jgi:hypothetical protein
MDTTIQNHWLTTLKNTKLSAGFPRVPKIWGVYGRVKNKKKAIYHIPLE